MSPAGAPMSRRIALVGVVIVAVLAVGAIAWRLLIAPPSAGGLGGNGIQPLADDLTWVYRGSASDAYTTPPPPLVVGIVGREELGSETAWLLQNGIGASWTTRVALVQRGDDIWALAVDGLKDGQWQRFTLPTAQLYQPGAGDRSWQTDYTGGPDAWGFAATWEQRANGRLAVLDREGAAWIVVGDLRSQGYVSRETDMFVDGVGLVSITTVAEGGPPIRWDLVALRRERGPIEGRYRRDPDAPVTLDVGPAVTITVGEGSPAPVTAWRVDGSVVTFDAADGSGAFTWSGRHAPAGLLGTATRSGGAVEVMDFPRVEASPAP